MHAWMPILAATAASAALALGVALVPRAIFDHVLPAAAQQSLLVLGIGVTIALCADTALRLARNSAAEKAAAQAEAKLQALAVSKALSARLDQGHQRILAAASGYIEQVRDAILARYAMADAALAVLYVALLLLLAGPAITAIPVGLGLGVLALGAVFSHRMDADIRASAMGAEAKRDVTEQVVRSCEDLRAATAGPALQRRLVDLAEPVMRSSLRLRMRAGILTTLIQQAAVVSQVGVTAVGAAMVIGGHLTVGSMVAALILAGRVFAPAAQAAGLLLRLGRGRTAQAMLQPLLEAETERADGVRVDEVTGEIRAQGLTYRYPGAPLTALAGLDLHIRAGETVGLVGPSGSGKSTLLRLIEAFCRPEAGVVSIDGIDVQEFDPANLRQHVGLLSQRPALLAGTLRDNLILGLDEVPDDKMLWRAATMAGLLQVVERNRRGLDMTIAAGGVSLSAGERQRVALARLIVRNPRIVLLDEPTSHLDQHSEAALVAALRPWLVGRTVIVVSHRSAPLALTSRIIAISDGRVAGEHQTAQVLRPHRIEERAA